MFSGRTANFKLMLLDVEPSQLDLSQCARNDVRSLGKQNDDQAQFLRHSGQQHAGTNDRNNKRERACAG